MKPSSWREVAELIGVAAIVASLLFVGLELRQSREIAISEAYQMRAATEVSHGAAIASVPGFISGLAKLIDGGPADALTTEEQIAQQFYITAQLAVWENDHFQYTQGYLSDEHWTKTYRNMLCDLTLPLYQEMATSDWSFRESFAEVVDQAIIEAKLNPSGCWSGRNVN
jgi:hypothetical protein